MIPPHLREELESRNHERRAAACYELEEAAHAADPEASTILLACLGDSHPQVRVAAAETLASGPGNWAAAVILSALETLPDGARSGHRSSLVHALGLLDTKPTGPIIDRLLAELGHRDADVRFRAITALNRLGCESPALRRRIPELLNDSDDEVAAVAATTAADFSLTAELDRVLERWRRARGFARRHLALAAARLGSVEVKPSLFRALWSGSEAIESIDALVQLGGAEDTLRVLHRTAKSWRVHPVLKARAAVALYELSDSRASDLLPRYLAHRKAILRRATMEWIARAGLHEFTDALIAILHDVGDPDSDQAAYSLGLLDSEVAQAALERAAKSDARGFVREEAAEHVRT